MLPVPGMSGRVHTLLPDICPVTRLSRAFLHFWAATGVPPGPSRAPTLGHMEPQCVQRPLPLPRETAEVPGTESRVSVCTESKAASWHLAALLAGQVRGFSEPGRCLPSVLRWARDAQPEARVWSPKEQSVPVPEGEPAGAVPVERCACPCPAPTRTQVSSGQRSPSSERRGQVSGRGSEQGTRGCGAWGGV